MRPDSCQGLISDALIKYGIFESMQTGARKVWRPVSGGQSSFTHSTVSWEVPQRQRVRHLQQVRLLAASFNGCTNRSRIKEEMTGRWADLAVSNEVSLPQRS